MNCSEAASILVQAVHSGPPPLCPQQQGEAMAGGEGRAGQQVELVAAPSGRAGREDPASGGAAQARPLQQGEEDGG